jgi:outer membrane immunogenic protein
MGKLLAGVTGLVVLAGTSAMAADIPRKAPPPPPPAIFTWTGFYVGGHLGWGWGESDSRVLEADNNFFPQGTILHNDFDGFIGGGQAGFNFQTGLLVFGVEGQVSWSGITGDSRRDAILLANRHIETHANVDWVATLTGRVGIAAGNALFYVKGGAAWAEFESTTHSFITSTRTLVQTVSGGETRDGWTVGAGVEWGIAGNWSFKGEYNFLDFGTDRIVRSGRTIPAGVPVTRFRDAELELHIVKFGINYRFGGPLVARY